MLDNVELKKTYVLNPYANEFVPPAIYKASAVEDKQQKLKLKQQQQQQQQRQQQIQWALIQQQQHRLRTSQSTLSISPLASSGAQGNMVAAATSAAMPVMPHHSMPHLGLPLPAGQAAAMLTAPPRPQPQPPILQHLRAFPRINYYDPHGFSSYRTIPPYPGSY